MARNPVTAARAKRHRERYPKTPVRPHVTTRAYYELELQEAYTTLRELAAGTPPDEAEIERIRERIRMCRQLIATW
jgi:hypothetical protein